MGRGGGGPGSGWVGVVGDPRSGWVGSSGVQGWVTSGCVGPGVGV